MSATSLSADQLRAVCDPASLSFDTTATLEPLEVLIGQDRAVEAIRLAAQMEHHRFNLYVHGPEGSGRHSAVLKILNEEAAGRPVPSDWVYVQNFGDPDRPLAIEVPRGMAPKMRAAMISLVEDLAIHIPSLLVSEDYQNRRRALEQEYGARHESAFEILRKAAETRNVAILRTPMGFSLAAMHGDEILKADAMERLSQGERQKVDEDVAATEQELEDFLLALPELEREQRSAIGQLNEEMAKLAVDAALSRAIHDFVGIPALAAYFEALRADLIAHADLFLSLEHGKADDPFPAQLVALRDDPRFHRYSVNVMITHGEDIAGAPVVVETLPTLANLTGEIDYIPLQGALVTDFTQIKPGALHRANGGFLVLDARRVLSEPYAWDALKRCLETRAVHLITAAERSGLIATTKLEPQPIPLRVRVVLVGDRLLHLLLSEHDPDFAQYFRVAAEFGEDMARGPESVALFARLAATVVAREGLRPVARDGVAALVDAATRAAEDQEKLSLRMGEIWDILFEADHLAGKDHAASVTADHVARAIAAADRRRGLTRDRLQEAIVRGIIQISTQGSVIGQVNGLTISALGEECFGAPVRITARVRMGTGRVVDIEREVRLGGPIHSKAVLILSSFLATRYVPDTPLSLWASLVFEQSYSGVEGDSASLAELCALLSALAEVPLSQSFAVTGSVNQMGEVQAVGGINEKIEGFFDVCQAVGLTGRQGVIIPHSNQSSLMLRPDVVEAVAAGRFQIHTVTNIDDAIEQLTGLPAGKRMLNGEFQEGSVNANIEVRLLEFADTRSSMLQLRLPEGLGGAEDA